MLKIVKDRYFLICISIFLVILVSFFVIPNEDNKDQKIQYGFVYGIKESSNGYVFQFQNMDNDIMKCYYQYEPKETFYMMEGNISDDGSIFFVSYMKSFDLMERLLLSFP